LIDIAPKRGRVQGRKRASTQADLEEAARLRLGRRRRVVVRQHGDAAGLERNRAADLAAISLAVRELVPSELEPTLLPPLDGLQHGERR